MTPMRRTLVTLLLLSLITAPASAQSGPQLTRSVVAGGGGASAQGSIRVEGVVGQSAAGPSAGGPFVVGGGFYFTSPLVNAQPTADFKSITTDENTSVPVTLSGMDEETPAAGLVFNVTSAPAHGTLSGSAPALTYTPATGYVGADSFKFTVTDAGEGAAPPLTSAEATVSINVIRLPGLFARGARAAEPASGQSQMLFTVTLDRAPSAPVSVDFTTADEPAGPGKAVAGQDYTPAGGSVTFQPGQRVRLVSVPVLSDASAEPDETFLLQLSNASGAHLDGAQATGAIAAAQPGAVLVSELRTSGPNGAGDDFVEVYNNSASPVTVGPTAWALVASNQGCAGDPVVVGLIPSGTVIPARGHYLFVGSQYSLGDYGGTGAASGDQTLTADIGSDANVALFAAPDLAGLSSAARLDGVGFGASTGDLCELLREGNTLPPAAGSAAEHSFVRELSYPNGVPLPSDSNDSAADFTLVSTTAPAAVGGATPLLGAPGPENLSSPGMKTLNQVVSFLLDGVLSSAVAPNRVRTGSGNSGTLSVRRTFRNDTGAPVTRLRLRFYDVTAGPAPAGTADLRAVTSGDTTAAITGVGTVTVRGTILEAPPAQAGGGGLNSSVVPTAGLPLAPGASIHLQLLFDIRQSGSFRVFVSVEALP